VGENVERVAQAIAEQGLVTIEAARAELHRIERAMTDAAE
jgi:hypothetical protein